MHDYSIDKHPKEKIIFLLSFITLLVAPSANTFMVSLFERLQISLSNTASIPIISIPLMTAFYSIFWMFNTYLWRFKILRKILLVPDLNGEWEVVGETIYKDGERTSIPWIGRISIKQSWSRMIIVLKTNTSVSESLTASINQKNAQGFRLVYSYNNRPNIENDELFRHDGLAQFTITDDCKRGEGDYFTDHNRMTSGKMKWEKINANK